MTLIIQIIVAILIAEIIKIKAKPVYLFVKKKIYLSKWIGTTRIFFYEIWWKRHNPEKYNRLQENKKMYVPNHAIYLSNQPNTPFV